MFSMGVMSWSPNSSGFPSAFKAQPVGSGFVPIIWSDNQRTKPANHVYIPGIGRTRTPGFQGNGTSSLLPGQGNSYCATDATGQKLEFPGFSCCADTKAVNNANTIETSQQQSSKVMVGLLVWCQQCDRYFRLSMRPSKKAKAVGRRCCGSYSKKTSLGKTSFY